MTIDSDPPGFSLRSNPGLQLANAFGVFKTECWINSNAFGVFKTECWISSNAFGVFKTECWISSNAFGVFKTECWISSNAFGVFKTECWAVAMPSAYSKLNAGSVAMPSAYSKLNECLSLRSVGFGFSVGGDLDDQHTDPGEQHDRDPATRREQRENYPGNNQPYADPPQHRDYGISFSL